MCCYFWKPYFLFFKFRVPRVLPTFVKMKLEDLNLASVEASPVDTYVDEENFFSYRRTTHRNEPDYGRQISVLVLDKG